MMTGKLSEYDKTTLATRIQSSWSDITYYPDSAEVRCATALVTSGYLEEDVMTTLATRIQSSWANPGYYPDSDEDDEDDPYEDNWPSDTEVHCDAALVTSGHLSEDVMTTLATRIQSAWSYGYWPSVTEVVC